MPGCIPNIKVMIDITSDLPARLHNLLQLNFNKIIIRVDMLFDKALDFQECGEEVPFIFRSVDRVCEGFVTVERLK